METIENIKSNHLHLGKKIERVRRLRGMTQTELGQLLGITKQAVSKMEQTEKIDDERLEKNSLCIRSYYRRIERV